jgi:lysozyme
MLYAMMRQINAAGLAIIKTGESLQLNAYLDPAGIPTIGWGHTPATMGTTITEEQADALLAADVSSACEGVNGVTSDVSTTDNQFSAMVSLTFNIGIGAFRGSTVLRLHRAGKYQGAADAFLFWNKSHVDGVLVALAGLTKRREQEMDLYLLLEAMA